MNSYRITLPSSTRIPIVLSIPHCGTSFPEELRDEFDPELMEWPDDTDWYVDKLYNFAPDAGITVISSVWSRWVIDLNRDPDGKPLYADGRIITGLCPFTTFLGQPLYRDRRSRLAEEEIQRRKDLYFVPYHDNLRKLLSDVKSAFGKVLLWDCHSIRQRVTAIRKEKFPDLILGSADEKSAHHFLITEALQKLRASNYSVQHNDPFKGGYITRHYGQPSQNQHALQLEMTKINYMDDLEKHFHPGRAGKMQQILYNTLSNLSEALISIKD